jgi:hypothetical protein
MIGEDDMPNPADTQEMNALKMRIEITDRDF